MESSAKYIWVGCFVLVSTLLLIASLLWLADASGTRQSNYYNVYFQQQTLDGLQKDSAVTMKGIRVGSVAEYIISPRSVEEVKILVRIGENTPIKTDATAVIRRNLLTGLAWIDLVGSTQDSPPLRAIPKGEQYPVIPEGQSELDQIAQSIPGLLERLGDLGNRMNLLLSDENTAAVSASLQNIRVFTGTLADSSESFAAIIKNLEGVTSDISETSAALKRFAKKTDNTLDGVGDQTMSTFKSIEDSVKELNKQTKEAIDSISRTARLVAQEIAVMSQSITSAAGSLSKTVEDFENPRSIISGPSKDALGPGEALAK